jgi:hypothetical protein
MIMFGDKRSSKASRGKGDSIVKRGELRTGEVEGSWGSGRLARKLVTPQTFVPSRPPSSSPLSEWNMARATLSPQPTNRAAEVTTNNPNFNTKTYQTIRKEKKRIQRQIMQRRSSGVRSFLGERQTSNLKHIMATLDSSCLSFLLPSPSSDCLGINLAKASREIDRSVGRRRAYRVETIVNGQARAKGRTPHPPDQLIIGNADNQSSHQVRFDQPLPCLIAQWTLSGWRGSLSLETRYWVRPGS